MLYYLVLKYSTQLMPLTMRDKMFGRTVSGFGSKAKRTTSPYVSFPDISTLSIDTDFATLQIDGSNYTNTSGMAVGADEIVCGLASVLSLGGSNVNLLSYDYDTSTTLATGTGSPASMGYAQDGSGNVQSTIRAACFSYNGDYLYVGGQADSNRVVRIALGTPYDLSSASGATSAQLGTAMNGLQGIGIIGDGTKFYAMRSTSGAVGEVIEYAMSTPYDLSTLSVTRTVTAAFTGNLSGGFCTDIAVAPDGGSFIIGSVGGSGAAGYQTILDQWPMTAGNITPISGSSGRVSANFSKNLSNTYDASGDDSDTYSQAFNFNNTATALILAGVHEDDGPSGTSNQWHVTRWT